MLTLCFGASTLIGCGDPVNNSGSAGKKNTGGAGKTSQAGGGENGGDDTGGESGSTGEGGGSTTGKSSGKSLCDGVDLSAVPEVGKWIDNFEDDGTKLDGKISWFGADDGTGNVDFSGGAESLETWGSYDEKSQYGYRMKAALNSTETLDSEHWGINWQYETEGGDPKNPVTGERASFDFSEYDGIVVWARLGDTEGAQKKVQIEFPTPYSLPTATGGDGSCSDPNDPTVTTVGENGKCYAHKTYNATISGTCWAPLKMDFNTLTVAFSPGPKSFDKAHVFGIEIAFSSSSAGNAKQYFPADIVFDDMYLYKK